MKFLSFLFWWVLVASALGQNGAGRGDAQTLSRVEVHFRLYRNCLIVVRGDLGCLEGLNFLIDTGANPTAVDKKIAEKLGLKGQSQKLELLDQSVLVEAVELPHSSVGPYPSRIHSRNSPGFIACRE